MNETFGPLQKGLRIGLALFVPGVFLAMFFGHVNSLDRQRRVLEQLRPDAVMRVILRPLPGYPAPVPDSVAIADRPVVEALVAVYRNLSPSGTTGRLPGTWQLRVTWVLRDGRRVASRLYHNEYADLVFFDPIGDPEAPTLDNFLVSTRIAPLLVPYLNQPLQDTTANNAP